MPATSGKQYRFMAMCSHNGGNTAACPPIKVAKEFVDATPKSNRSKWSKAIKKRRNK